LLLPQLPLTSSKSLLLEQVRIKVMMDASFMWFPNSVGSGGLSVANQLYNRFDAAGKTLNSGDIAVIDAAEYHHYQVCCK
jgi:hypothetical protein